MAILLGQRKVQCAIFNSVGHLIYLAESYSKFFDLRGDQLKNTLEELPQANSNKVVCGISEEFAIIPEKYFLDRALAPYLHEHLGEDYEDNYVYDNLNEPKARVAYHLNESIEIIVKKVYPSIKIVNSITASIKYFVEEEKLNNTIITNLFEDGFEYIGIKDNSLQMANRYSAETAENYLYFLLTAAKHNEIDVEHANVHIHGSHQEMEQFQALSQKYLNIAPHKNVTADLPAIESYIVLKALSKCA